MSWTDLLRIGAPVVTLIAALARALPGLAVSAASRRRSRHTTHEDLRLLAFNTSPPWDKYKNPWPRDWSDPATRLRYRRKEKLWLWVFLVVFGGAMCFYGVVVWDDLWNADLIAGHQGEGYLAAPAFALFLVLFIFQARYLAVLRGDRALAETLYGAEASVSVQGELTEIRQFAIAALYDAGCRLVSASCELRDDSGRSYYCIIAATGFWPPPWTNWQFFQLISFRGEKVEVRIVGQGDSVWDLSVSSDNMDPGVDEGKKANQRNVKKFVDSWAFFPGAPGGAASDSSY